MGTSQKEKKDRAAIFLRAHNLGTICVVSPENTPWAATILYGLDDDLNFCFVIRSGTRKYDYMKANNMVSLVVTDEKSLKTIQMQGKVTEITDAKQQIDASSRLSKAAAMGAIDWPPPVAKMQKGSYKFMKITPTWMRFADFRGLKKKTGAGDWFEQIIP